MSPFDDRVSPVVSTVLVCSPQVLFSAIKAGDGFDRLVAFAAHVRDSLVHHRVVTSLPAKEFAPHLTVAKCSKNFKVKRLAESAWAPFATAYWGAESFHTLELLHMNGPKDADGFYRCAARVLFAEPRESAPS